MDLWSMRDNSFSKLTFLACLWPLRQERKAKANLESRQEAYLARLTKAHLNDEVGRFSLKYLPSGLHTSFAGWQVQKREDGDASAKERQAQVQVFQVYIVYVLWGKHGGSKHSIELEAELSLCWSHPGKSRKTPGFEKDGFWRILVSQDSSLTDAAVGWAKKTGLWSACLGRCLGCIGCIGCLGCEMLRNVAKCCKKLKSRAARAGVHWGDGREVGSCQISALSELQHFWQSLCTSLKALDSADITSFGHSLCR